MIPHRPILKGVPIPPRPGPQATKSQVFHDMEVGDAKDFHGGTGERHNWQSLATGYGRKNGKRFESRTLTQGGVPFIRIWRTK